MSLQQTFTKSNCSLLIKRSIEKKNYMELMDSKEFEIKKLSKGQLVYVKNSTEGWIYAAVVDSTGSVATVQTSTGQTLSLDICDVLLRSSNSQFVDSSRLTEMSPINEASVLECLHQRFTKDIFYTAAGSTIIAVNPFKDVPHLYDVHKILEYHQHHKLLDPHIYVIAESAYVSMVRELGKVNQSIIVSGESGAGKTVSAKHLLRYVTIVSSPEHESNLNVSLNGSAIERRVLDSNPILEAFGNAATPRNENSSRFGKFIQLQFNRNGFILGGVIQTYLLEKTRVVHQGVGENNFHIFYQLLSLAELSSAPQWLEEVKEQVRRSKFQIIVPQDENMSVLQVVEAMTDIGVEAQVQVSIFQVLLAVLHLTSIKFISCKDGEMSSVSDDEDFSNAAFASNWSKDECSRILGISPLSLHHAMLNRSIVSGTRAQRSVYVKPVGVEEARSRRDCLAMLLYARLFDWLVSFINHQIKAPQFERSISLLDIYGFETFQINGLEQLCINYANERLQQQYVSYFLRDLQAEYEMERIPWSSVSYKDNKICVETLDRGLFGILNEEVYLSRKSHDNILCSRIASACGSHGVVRKSHVGTYETTFYVRHYAGDVLYTVSGAVVKNKDNIPPELISLLGTSDNSFVLNLFTDDEFAQTEQSLASVKTKKKKTVLTKFKSSLDSLMSSLERSDIHYIRCIKPNSSSKADCFERVFVLQQLQACGILETVNICRLGYPARMSYHDFIQRYGVFIRVRSLASHPDLAHAPCRDGLEKAENSQKEAAEAFYEKVKSHLSSHDGLLNHTEHKRLRRKSACQNDQELRVCAHILMAAFTNQELHDCHYQFGLHKIFLKQTQLEHLEHNRASIISFLVRKAQAAWRANIQRRLFSDMKVASVKVQANWRACLVRKMFCVKRLAARRIQRAWRMHKMRQTLKKISESSRTVKKFLVKWVRRRRFLVALKKMRQQQRDKSKMDKVLQVSSESLIETSSGYVDAQEFLSRQTNVEISGTFDHNDNGGFENDDSSGHWSDDSGVMIKDDAQGFPVDPGFEAPPAKKPRVTVTFRTDLRMGNGVITCRRLTKPGFRFHVRKSVLKFGHNVHYSELPHGLVDALLEHH